MGYNHSNPCVNWVLELEIQFYFNCACLTFCLHLNSIDSCCKTVVAHFRTRYKHYPLEKEGNFKHFTVHICWCEVFFSSS